MMEVERNLEHMIFVQSKQVDKEEPEHFIIFILD